MAKRRKKYRYSDPERRRKEHKSSDFKSPVSFPSGVKLFQPKKPGVYRIDIIPYVVGKRNKYADEGILHWECTYWCHKNVGADNEQYLCPNKIAGQRCPICEYRAKLANDPDADEDLIKELRPKERQLFNVVDVANRDAGVQVWDMSHHLFGKLLDERLEKADEDDEWDNFYHLEDGLTLRITLSEESLGRWTYLKASAIDFKPRKRQYDESILEETFCLDEMLVLPDYDELRKAFLQVEEEEEEEEEPPKKSRKRRTKPEPEPEPEEDEEWEDEEEDVEEEEEEEEPPKKRSTKKSTKRQTKSSRKARKEPEPEPEPEEDEEDDDWDDDDWDDEDWDD